MREEESEFKKKESAAETKKREQERELKKEKLQTWKVNPDTTVLYCITVSL